MPEDQWRQSAEADGRAKNESARVSLLLSVAALVVITLSLVAVGIDWGLPNDRSWNYDSVAGTETIRMLPKLFSEWDGQRYPRTHFLLTGTVYRHKIRTWQDDATANRANPWEDPSVDPARLPYGQVSELIRVSRWISAAMAAGAVVLVFLATVRLIGSIPCAFLATLILAFSPPFVFFGHLGNLDVPVLFWFVLTGYLGIVAIQNRRWWAYAMMGGAAGLAVTTKDPIAGQLLGIAILVVGVRYAQARSDAAGASPVWAIATDRNMWIALSVFFFVYIWSNGILTHPEAYIDRMTHWAQVKHAYRTEGGQHGRLVIAAMDCLRRDVGPVMIFLVAGSMAWVFRRRSVLGWIALVPLVSFHLLVTTNALQVQPRYHLPSVACMIPAVAYALNRLRTEGKGLWTAIGWTVFGLALVSEAVAGYSVSAEMRLDTRIRAERWMNAHLADPALGPVVFVSPIVHMPRPHQLVMPVGIQIGGRTGRFTDETVLANRPNVIALSDLWYADPIFFDQGFRQRLLAGDLGYTELKRFQKNHGRWLRWAKWGFPAMPTLSPTIVLMRHAGANAAAPPSP